jgi:rare lipoprotein A
MQKKISNHVYPIIFSLLSSTMTVNACATETGLASYYSDKFQGRKTASGQRYDKNKLTAAHRTLPLGSQIEIINPKNQSSVIVTINDRGPYHGHRLLDLSYAAAKELGIDRAGVGQVSFELVSAKTQKDIENFIPSEFIPLEVAKSEEEVLEAEEEAVNANPALNSAVPKVESIAEVSIEEQAEVSVEASNYRKKPARKHHQKIHAAKKRSALKKRRQ